MIILLLHVDDQKITWTLFDASKYEYTFPILVEELGQKNDCIVRLKQFTVYISEPVRSIENDSLNVIVPGSLFINIYDNACEYSFSLHNH